MGCRRAACIATLTLGPCTFKGVPTTCQAAPSSPHSTQVQQKQFQAALAEGQSMQCAFSGYPDILFLLMAREVSRRRTAAPMGMAAGRAGRRQGPRIERSGTSNRLEVGTPA